MHLHGEPAVLPLQGNHRAAVWSFFEQFPVSAKIVEPPFSLNSVAIFASAYTSQENADLNPIPLSIRVCPLRSNLQAARHSADMTVNGSVTLELFSCTFAQQYRRIAVSPEKKWRRDICFDTHLQENCSAGAHTGQRIRTLLLFLSVTWYRRAAVFQIEWAATAKLMSKIDATPGE